MFICTVCTTLSYICYCLSIFCKEKKNMLILDLVAKVLTIIGFYFIGSLTGAYNMLISIAVLSIAFFREKKGERYKLTFVYVLFQLAYIVILALTFTGISSILIFTTSSLSLLSIWWLKPQQMRVLGLFLSIIYLIYQLSIHNIAGILELFVIVSNFISYRKYMKSETLNIVIES